MCAIRFRLYEIKIVDVERNRSVSLMGKVSFKHFISFLKMVTHGAEIVVALGKKLFVKAMWLLNDCEYVSWRHSR